jgi:hypothetical protein
MVDLIEQCQMACDKLIDVAVTRCDPSGVGVVGAAGGWSEPAGQAANWGGRLVWPAIRTVMLSDRKLAAKRPRLRQKGPGASKKVEVPAL